MMVRIDSERACTARPRPHSTQGESRMPVSQTFRIDEARDSRARDVLKSVMEHEPLMRQFQESLAAVERGEIGVTWEYLE